MRKLILFAAIVQLSVIYVQSQQPFKHLYLGNDTHTDLMWNSGEEEWYKINLGMAKSYLNQGEYSKNNAPEARPSERCSTQAERSVPAGLDPGI